MLNNYFISESKKENDEWFHIILRQDKNLDSKYRGEVIYSTSHDIEIGNGEIYSFIKHNCREITEFEYVKYRLLGHI